MSFLAESNKTSGNNRLAGLDHLRALAIILVLLFHYRLFDHPAWLDVFGKFGWTGVDLFFVLSGYLISFQLFSKIKGGNKISFREFFIRRVFRIIPAYAVVVAIYFCVPAFREWEALPPLWRFLTFTQNLGLDLRVNRTFSHAWSLCIEEQFYLLLPLTLIALVYYKLVKAGIVILIGLFLFGFVVRIYSWQHLVAPSIGTEGFIAVWYKCIYYPTWCRLDGLLTGISIAAFYEFYPLLAARISKYGNALLLAGVIILTGAYYVCLDEHSFIASVFGFPVVSIGYGVMVMGAVSPSCILYKSRSWITSRIAVLSFAIYLVHKGVIHIVQQQFAKLGIADDGNTMFLLCIISSFVGALLLNMIIEKPFLKLRRKITG